MKAGALGFWLVVAAFGAASSGEYALEPLAERAPAEVSSAVRAELAEAGLRAVGEGGKSFADLWLRREVPLGPARDLLGVRYPKLEDGTLLGAVRYHADGADFRGTKVAPGVYTLRYMTQPEDGDHQGTAESRDFALLLPAAEDGSPGRLKAEEAVRLSTKVSRKKHPAVLYLAPREGGEGPARLGRDEEKGWWFFDVAIPAAGGGEAVRLGVVFVGKAAE
jgi:hypothetical protein